MDWFCLVATLWFVWLIFIIVSLIAIIIVLLQEIIERRKAKKKKFDKAFPQWSIFRTMLRKQNGGNIQCSVF